MTHFEVMVYFAFPTEYIAQTLALERLAAEVLHPFLPQYGHHQPLRLKLSAVELCSQVWPWSSFYGAIIALCAGSRSLRSLCLKWIRAAVPHRNVARLWDFRHWNLFIMPVAAVLIEKMKCLGHNCGP